MNPLILVWSVGKLYYFIGFVILRFWKVWVVLLALEGGMSVFMDQSLIRRTLLYNPTQVEIERVLYEIECEKQQAQNPSS